MAYATAGRVKIAASISLGVMLFCCALSPGQQDDPKAVAPLAPIAMPADRAAESYAIYSSLLPIGEIANAGWEHELWLVEEATTTLASPDRPCSKLPGAGDSSWAAQFDPRTAAQPDAAHQHDYAEILDDYFLNCHERIMLDPEAWKTTAPVRLLDRQQQEEFRGSRATFHGKDEAVVAKYKRASALFAFSRVYFNAHHTVAMVFVSQWCGSLCGEDYWQAVELVDGRWKRLDWATTHGVS
ncbi:MAG TPA: hypothetical protein VGD59_00725 [Acidisarcina sp.]